MDENDKTCLKIYENRSEYISKFKTQIFFEGKVSPTAKLRANLIKQQFGNGFLSNVIDSVINKKDEVIIENLSTELIKNISELVDSVTSEVGRGLVALTVMQLSIKSISPEQSIRLHKGSVNRNSFSWAEGISMRVLDKNYVTPILRKYNLIKLNADGFMMTRSLAENYPYTKLYKAKLRGARLQWMNIVEILETNNSEPLTALKYIISLLLNKAADFNVAANDLIKSTKNLIKKNNSTNTIQKLIFNHIEKSDYAARLMEVAMHSLFQVGTDSGAFGYLDLKPLSQMRSANKKHGNIGDIELLEDKEIIESWDAKYGKNYLRDEIDEIIEKLEYHDKVETVGFVTTDEPIRNQEVLKKIQEFKDIYNLEIEILSFTKWVENSINRILESQLKTTTDISNSWLLAYAESLAQKRRHYAPIDEPCLEWVTSLKEIIDSYSL